jgi:hypothetical protein
MDEKAACRVHAARPARYNTCMDEKRRRFQITIAGLLQATLFVGLCAGTILANPYPDPPSELATAPLFVLTFCFGGAAIGALLGNVGRGVLVGFALSCLYVLYGLTLGRPYDC